MSTKLPTPRANAARIKEFANIANRHRHLEVLAAIYDGADTYQKVMAECDWPDYGKCGAAINEWKKLGLVEIRKAGGPHRTLHPADGGAIEQKLFELIFA